MKSLFAMGLAAGLLAGCAAVGANGRSPLRASPLPHDYQWKSVVVGGGGFVTGLVFHPLQPLLYARTDVGGAYRRDENQWVALQDSAPYSVAGIDETGVLSLALDPTDLDRVYLATGIYTQSWWPQKGNLLASQNRGETWTRHPFPFQLGGNQDGRGCGERLQVNPHDPRQLYLGTSKDGLWTSHNRGKDWEKLPGFESSSVNFVFLDPAKKGRLVVGVHNTNAGLQVSEDAGATFKKIEGIPTGLMALRWALSGRRLLVTVSDSVGPNDAKKGGLWAWHLDTETLQKLPLPEGMGGYSGVTVDANNPNVIMVSTLNRWNPGDEIYRSIDGGKTWKEILRSGKREDNGYSWVLNHNPHWIADVQIDPHDSNQAWFVTGYGLWASVNLTAADHGEQVRWLFKNEGLEETVPLKLLSPPWGAPLYSAMGDQMGFSHWNLDKPPSRTHGEPHWGTSRGLAAAWNKEGFLARVGRFDKISGLYSQDSGASWKAFETSIVKPGEEPGKIGMTSDGLALLWCPGGKPAQRSEDMGKSWTPIQGLPDSLDPQADTVDPNLVYALDGRLGAVFVSHDGGASFKKAWDKFPKNGDLGHSDLRPVPGRRGHVWAGLDQGLFISIDMGKSFRKVEGISAAGRLGFGAPAPGAPHAAAYIAGTINGEAGFFQSVDSGQSWKRINDDQHQFGWINAIVGDARVFGRVYVATGGRGILYGEPGK